MKIAVGLLLALGASLVAPASDAHDYRLATLAIAHPFARATPPGAQIGGAYMTIDNTGAAADQLVRASSPAADAVQIHSMAMQGNVMRMREVSGLDLPAGGRVELKPGGYHLMLVGLRKPLAEGTRVPLTLTFAHAGSIDVEVAVEPMTAGGHATH
jgi:periplasmic copper chaperone A